MYLLNLDSEQAMILVTALEATNTLMSARLHRVDPGRIISDSVRLQASKIDNIKAQIEGGALARWSDLNDADRALWRQKMVAWHHAPELPARQALYDSISAFVISHRAGVMPLLHKAPQGS